MNGFLSGKGMKLKALSVLIAICFSTVSINTCVAHQESVENSLCYGFIVSSVIYENATVENQVNCKIKNMINDLLREQIPVFWSAANITISIRELFKCDNEKKMTYGKGTFIVPFTGNKTQDGKLIAIIYDYNQSSEIEENDTIKIPVYLLMEPLDVQAYPLTEVKIAQNDGIGSYHEVFYLNIAKKCGFLTFEFLDDKNITKKLNNDNFNVFMWPQGGSKSTSFFYLKTIANDLKSKSLSVTERNFVSNGGGYIGSCYGAYKASCSMLPFPIYFKRRAYNPNLRSYGLLAISDIITIPVTKYLNKLAEERIIDDEHPVTYGIRSIVFDIHAGGPKIIYVGKNSHAVAILQNSSPYLDGTPSWISSQFGNGKVMLFTTHPETVDSDSHPEILTTGLPEYYEGKKIISNALYYTTSKELTELQISRPKNLSDIEEIWANTSDLTNNTTPTGLFDKIYMKINETRYAVTNLTDDGYLSLDLISKIAEENNIDVENVSYTFLGFLTMYFSLYRLDLILEDFNSIETTLKKIEKIYSLLESNEDFIQQLELLKNEMLIKINETQLVISQSQKINKDNKDALLRYQHTKIFSKLKEKNIEKIAHDLLEKAGEGIVSLSQIFFDSLKFLRHHWYNYEANMAP